MATIADSEEKPEFSQGAKSLEKDSKTLEETPWIEYAVQQAQFIQKTIEETVDSAIEISSSRISEIRSTSSAHIHQTLDTVQNIKSEYDSYEDIFFGKIKEGIIVATSHPVITCGVAVGLGFVTLKRPRRFLYHKTLHLFMSEEKPYMKDTVQQKPNGSFIIAEVKGNGVELQSLLSRADNKVKELRQSIDLMKAESEKLEKRALQAEEEMKRGRTKLRQTGNQIQGVIRSAYKIERQARGLKDILGELPSRESSRFRSQVSNLASEAKRERNALTKEVSKISNYGISI